MIIGLDFGTRCGYAVLRSDDSVAYGEWSLQRDRLRPGIQWYNLLTYLHELGDPLEIELIAYEKVTPRTFKDQNTRTMWSKFEAAVEIFATRYGIKIRHVHTATLKKHTTGSGRADKAAMMDAAKERWGLQVLNHNEADALAVLGWAEDKHRVRRLRSA